MMKREMLAGFACSWLCACAPMEQAPLVYTSSHQFGVQVAAGAPEAPGFSVNIGYRGLDAAFVPVAVAKYCGSSPSADCENAIYSLRLIKGQSDQNGSSSVNEQILERAEATIQQLRDSIAREEIEISSAEAQKRASAVERARVAALNTEKAKLEAVPAAQDGIVERTNRISEITLDLNRISDLPADASIDRTIQNRKSRVAALRTALQEQEDLAARLRSARNAQSVDAKDDAYSVYGSFNGGSSGNRDGAELKLGKVFSTGIAAQNLTQGLQRAAAIAAQAECLNKLSAVAQQIEDKDKRAQFLLDTSGMCDQQDMLILE